MRGPVGVLTNGARRSRRRAPDAPLRPHPRRLRLAHVAAAVGVCLSLTAVTAIRAERAEAATSLWPGFVNETVFGGLTGPVAVRFSPDGRVFVAEKYGLVKVFDSLDDPTATVFADLRTQVFSAWDRGLLGLALHPDFPATPWVYVLYTYDAAIGGTAPRWGSVGGSFDFCPTPPGPNGDGCVVSGRLSRLEAAGDTMTGDEHVLIEDWCQQYPSHSIGDLAFGADGALYVSAGEGASYDFVDYGQEGTPVNPCGDPPDAVGGAPVPPAAEGGALRSQDIRTGGDPTGLDGTILRVDPITGAGLPGNPLFASSDPNRRRIVASGLRNPYRIAIRPGTDEVWSGDVGWNTWEEINRVTDPTDSTVDNFGWPCYEGDNRQAGYDAADFDICEGLYDAGPGAVVSPRYKYNHAEHVMAGDRCEPGTSSTSGLAFAPTGGGSYPAPFDGALFFGDYSRQCIWVMLAGTDGVPDPSRRYVFATGDVFPVDLQFGPDGSLYFADVLAGSVKRIRYTDGPQAVVAADPTSGPTPLTVSFSSTGSHDAGGGPITYQWDLDGDGAFDDSTAASPSYTYTQDGAYTAALRVTDSSGSSDSTSVTISAGESPPTPVIDAPGRATTWAVDDAIAFSGHATDNQDGRLPATSLSWSLLMHHCPSNCHSHQMGAYEDVASGSFVAPDHEYPSYIELRLTATDSAGLSSTASVDLSPETTYLAVQSEPAPLALTVGPTSQTSPLYVPTIVGSTLSVSAPSPQTVDGTEYRFVRWSDGGAASHNVTVEQLTILTATYEEVVTTPPPTADAGPDTAVGSGKDFTLTGTGTPAGQPLDYHWQQVSGPVAVLRDEDTAEVTVEGVSGPATLVFELTVTDAQGRQDTDTVVVTVRKPK